MTSKAEIRMKLPSLNEYINICRANKFKSAKWKQDLEEDIGWWLTSLPQFKNPVWIHFHWIEENMKRDKDNIASAKKYILDALVKFGKLKNDSWKYIAGFDDTFEIGKKAKVILYIDEEEN